VAVEDRGGDGRPAIRVVPFVPGRRPTDEATWPGLGSSDQAALLLGRPPEANRAYVLFSVAGRGTDSVVDATLSLGDAVLPGWDRRPLELRCFDGAADRLRPARAGDTQFVLALEPERDLRRDGDGGADPFGFEHMLLRRLDLELRLLDGGAPVSTARTSLDVCDVRRLGLLYERVLDRVVAPDADRQAAAAGVESPGVAYHPWFPVLLIGSDKAELYTRALVADIVDKQSYLPEPSWLLRVGIYLELLTCIGIAEAVRDDAGDLLTESERAALESDGYAPVRERVDRAAWRGVWALREITFPRRGVPRAGPVSVLNLLNKKRATLSFLHVHHEDLKQAVELAGPNATNAQETWQRVFRDAERAVLRQTPAAFPELGFLPAAARDVVLWHRRGRIDIRGTLRVPNAISALMADQDGLYPAACNQYRASMNAVATWAKERSLMNPSGRECVPRRVSLLEAVMDDPARVSPLQQRDGYESLDVAESPDAAAPPVGDAEELLAGVPIFAMLGREELRALARSARPLALGPTERFVVQGSHGTSLFVVADGQVEVVLRRRAGPDLRIDTMGRGAVFGEMSLLTGAPRSATVRALDHALVYEIGRRQYEPVLRAHREWVDQLAGLMEERLRARSRRVEAYDARRERDEISRRVLRRFFREEPDRGVSMADLAE